jgi:TonB-linked SusC/RagA family outer membrane protein
MRKVLLTLFLFGLATSILLAQGKIVTGKVTSGDDGNSLPGVNISVKGTAQGVISSSDGSYTINVSSENSILVFSFVGYGTQEIMVGNRSEINVSMQPDIQTLQEVVTVAYGTSTKKSLTGSLGVVDGSQLASIPMPSVDQMLQGKVAGLQSTSFSGQPGANQQVRIRGIGSISASSDPLYVVDGVPINSGDLSRLSTSSNALAGINSSDIESVTVLKDAASTSIYGSRAANGVILITTKKGKAGKTKIQASGEYGLNDIAIPDLAKPMNRTEYLDINREGLVNAGATQAQIDATLNSLGATNNYDVDWLSLVTRQGITQQYNLSLSGGDNKTLFYISGGYYSQEATVIASNLKRYSAVANVKHNVSEKLSMGLNMNISGANQLSPLNGGAFGNPILSAYFLRPTQNAYNDDGTLNYSLTTFPSIYNPVALAEYDKRKMFTLKGLGNINVEYRPVKNLSLSTRYGVDFNNLEENQYNNPFFGDGRTVNGRAYAYYTRYFNWTWTNLADYHLNLNSNQDIFADIKVGYEAQKSAGYFINAYSNNFPTTLAVTLPVNAATPITGNANASDYTFGSLFSNLSLNYKSKYILTSSFRRDASSRFGSENRYGNFYSVGGAWNIDQEAFLENLVFISGLKLRASYGVNGNGGLGNYQWRATYGYGYNYNQNPGSAPNNIGNANLTWELNKPFNIGTDISLFGDKISLTVDYYVRKTSRLLLDVPLSRTSGFSTITDNIGAMENKGWEFTINATPVKQSVRWDINFNIALNKNKITALSNNQDILSGSFIRRVGQDYQTFYLREWAGVDSETGNPQWYLNTTNADGTIDRSLTTNYNAAQRVMYKSATPKAFGGLNNTVSYKGFTFDAQLNFNFGNYLQDTWALYYMGDGFNPTFNKIKAQLNRWQKPGDISDNPKYVYGNTNNSYSASTRYLRKGDFIRIRNISLTYQLPKSILTKTKLDQVSIYVRGTNLFTKTFDKNLYFDPEQGIAGQTNLNIFIAKTYSMGINIGL